MIKIIAFHLPQFHPIQENNEWWGEGFTEWTNVAKARPLFNGHYQPKIPGDLGFYDLRLEESRIAQADLAKEFGIYGFCYWHYWFAGKRILERPVEEIVRTGKPDFPFCLGWANGSWTGIWHGSPDRLLIEQTYPGEKDIVEHFYSILHILKDRRYIKYDNKPLFVVHRAFEVEYNKLFTSKWQSLAKKEGLDGIHFVANLRYKDSRFNYEKYGYNACIWENPTKMIALKYQRSNIIKQTFERLRNRLYRRFGLGPVIYEYEDLIKYAFDESEYSNNNYPCVCPNWDNTPRSGRNGLVINNSTPELFAVHFKDALDKIKNKPDNDKVIFIKSWNEWAEGNYLEPDLKFKNQYLAVIRDNL